MNLRTGRVQSEELSGLPSEYPRGNDARSIHAHRYSYLVVNPAEEMPGLHRAVQSLDLKTGQSRVFDFGVGHACQEPVFVPDPARTGQADNSGWLMGYVYDSSQRQTHCYIIDAQHVEDGPVCLLHMPSHVGFTFHGTWHPAPGGIQAG